MSGLPWHSMKEIPYSSIVGGGMMLLNEDGACIGQVAVLGAKDAKEMTEAVNRQLLSAPQLLEALEKISELKALGPHPSCKDALDAVAQALHQARDIAKDTIALASNPEKEGEK